MHIAEHKNTTLKLRGIKNPNDNQLDVAKPLPRHNHFSLFVGLPGAGKSSLMINLLTQKNAYRGKYDHIYFFSGSMHTLPDKFTTKLHPERVFHDLDNLEEMVRQAEQQEGKSLFVIDDLMASVKEHEKIFLELVSNRRHKGGGVSVWLVCQKLRVVPLSVRTQVDSIYFFGSSAKNRKELEALYTDYITELSKEEFATIMHHVFGDNDPHTFLYVDKREGSFHKNFNRLEFHTY